MEEKYKFLEEYIKNHDWKKKYDYDYYPNEKINDDIIKKIREYDAIRRAYTHPQKTKEQKWEEELEKMDIVVIEKFLRKKKLERIKNGDK